MFQEDALARAALSDDGGNLVFIDAGIHLVENSPVPESLGHVPEFYECCPHGSFYTLT